MKLPEEDLKKIETGRGLSRLYVKVYSLMIVHLLVLSVELFITARYEHCYSGSWDVYRRRVNRSGYTLKGRDMTSTIIPFAQFQKTAYEVVVAGFKALF